VYRRTLYIQCREFAVTHPIYTVTVTNTLYIQCRELAHSSKSVRTHDTVYIGFVTVRSRMSGRVCCHEQECAGLM